MGLDYCLWDFVVKVVGVLVYKLLGGEVCDRIKVYVGVYIVFDVGVVKEEFDCLYEGWGFLVFKFSLWCVNLYVYCWGEVVCVLVDYFCDLCEMVDISYDIVFDVYV